MNSKPIQRTFVVGDVHGQLDKLTALLRNAGLLTYDLRWCGGNSALWFMGDFFDRGPHGLAVVELVMRLQQESAAAGGRVQSIIGNHDLLLMAVHHFGGRSDKWADFFAYQHRQNGGCESDLHGLLPSHIQWLSRLPAMAHVQTLLLAHADSRFYVDYGSSVEEVNNAFGTIVGERDPQIWDLLLTRFSAHNGFADTHARGGALVFGFLDQFMGSRFIHGHSPIHGMIPVLPQQVKGAHIYAHRLCINVDGGMYAGGPGFVFEVPPDWM
jgi:hypothetical protein